MPEWETGTVIQEEHSILVAANRWKKNASATSAAPALDGRLLALDVVMTTRSSRPFCGTRPRSFGRIRTVLVVEDESFVAQVTCEVLKRAGFHVLHAGTATGASEMFLAAEGQIDLLLCDAVLPDGNGMELSRYLQKQRPQLHTVFASGYPLSMLERGGPLPAQGILGKPYSSQQLLAAVKKALVSSRRRKTTPLRQPQARQAVLPR